ncbi:MAG: hypothetical protein E6G30_06075 [Actinobacteria bacterium]|nr:MAG: hypothetical protein E6G30_06075 [Actinomycetota bacterium]
MIEAEHEGLRLPREGAGEGHSDAVTFAFGEGEAELFGLARIGLQPREGSAAAASALALLFSAGEVVTALAEGDVEVAEPSWADVAVDGLRMETTEPLRAWRVALDAAGSGFDLRFAAVSPPVELAALGGMEGYEQLCRVEGTVTVEGEARPIACLGQRGHGWGAPDWSELELARTVTAWWDDSHALTLSAIRPAGAREHDQEALSAFLVDAGEAEDEAAVLRVAEPRLSTTYDAQGRQRRAGLELWVAEEDELPRRAAGQVACGTSLELGRLRLDCAFFDWRMEGRVGVGRYDIVRRA